VMHFLKPKKDRHNTAEVLQAFARSHGYRFDASGAINGSEGHIFAIGRNKRVFDVVSGKDNDDDIRCFNYKFTLNTGRDQVDVEITVMEYDLQVSVPDLIIEPAMLDELGLDLVIPEGYKRLSLEGNFDKKFHTYMISGSQVDILEILTPDVMEIMLDAGNKYNTELAGTRLIISRDELAKSSDDLELMFDLGKALAAKIRSTAKIMSFDGGPEAAVLAKTRIQELVKYRIRIGIILLIGGVLIYVVMGWAPTLSY